MVLVVVVISFVLISYQGQPLPKSVEEVKCAYPVTVQGPSMEPAIKAGSRLILNKCTDKQDIPDGAIVVFSGENNVANVGRVKDRTSSRAGVSYQVGKDRIPNKELTVSADKIIASDQK